jgi:ketosteroid isomerase-like protein
MKFHPGSFFRALLVFLLIPAFAASAAESVVVNANPTPSRFNGAAHQVARTALRGASLEAKIEHLLDRAELTDLVTAYAYSVDTRDWTLHTSIFTADYEINTDGTFRKQTAAQRGAALSKFFTAFEATQHLMVPETFEITGDTAYVTATMHARHFHSNGDPAKNSLLFGQYEFWCRRTAEGWKIARMSMVNRTRFTTAPGLPQSAK